MDASFARRFKYRLDLGLLLGIALHSPRSYGTPVGFLSIPYCATLLLFPGEEEKAGFVQT